MTQMVSDADSRAIAEDTTARIEVAMMSTLAGSPVDPAELFGDVGQEPVFAELAIMLVHELADAAAQVGVDPDAGAALLAPVWAAIHVAGHVGYGVGQATAFDALAHEPSEPDWGSLLGDDLGPEGD